MKVSGDGIEKSNIHLPELPSKGYEAYQAIIKEYKILTADMIKNKFTGVAVLD